MSVTDWVRRPAHVPEGLADEQTGMAAGTRILTAEGALPVELLGPGDRVVTRAGMRVLRQIDWVIATRLPIVRIGASALGHDRPGADTDLGMDQRVHLSGWRARTLWGAEACDVPAGRLVDHRHVTRVVLPVARLIRLRFDQDEAVLTEDGLALFCA